MISSLRNPGMRDRHWKKISDRLGFELSPHAGFTLSTALQLNLPSFLPIIDEVDFEFLIVSIYEFITFLMN